MVKIRTRLFIAFLILAGWGFYEMVDWIVDDLRPHYKEAMEESMVDTATLLSSFLANQVKDEAIIVDDLRAAFNQARKRAFRAKIYTLTKTRLNIRVYVTDRKGIVLFDSDDGRDEGQDYSRWNDVVKTLRGEYGARTTRSDPDDQSTSALYVASPIKLNGEIIGVLTVCKPTNSVTVFLENAKREIIEAGVQVGLAVIILGIVISFWITRPIQKLTHYAKSARDGKRTSLPKLGHSEIGVLGNAFEEMRESLEGKKYVENYVQTLTHEIKSPLSAIRGAAELLEEEMSPDQRRQFLSNIRTESDRIQDFVDRLLQLSAIEKRKGLREIEDMNLTDLLTEIIESMKPAFSAKQISVVFDQSEPVIVKGEIFLIRQSLSNLFQNAIDFSSQNGQISVSLEKKDAQVEIVISDTGSGIPDYAFHRLFDRFYSLKRPDTGKKSSGLGLTFVREVASLHGGTVQLENRSPAGARATFRLPLTPPQFLY